MPASDARTSEGHGKPVHELVLESAASRGASIGWNQQLDRLAAYLAKH